MQIKLRIHIVPVGHEYDRIVIPLIQQRAERVYFLTNLAKKDTGEVYLDRIKNRLKEVGMEDFSVVHCDIENIYDIFRHMMKIIEKERGNLIYLNLSSGKKTFTIAGTMIAMMLKEEQTEIIPYYVNPERYSSRNDNMEAMSYGVAGIYEIPTFKVDLPDESLIRVMKYISDAGIYKKREIVDFVYREKILTVKGSAAKKIMAANRQVFDKLSERGLIRIMGARKSATVKLTENGKQLVNFFCEVKKVEEIDYKHLFEKIESPLKKTIRDNFDKFMERLDEFKSREYWDYRNLSDKEIFRRLTYVIFFANRRAATIEAHFDDIMERLFAGDYERLCRLTQEEKDVIVAQLGFGDKCGHTFSAATIFKQIISDFGSFRKYLHRELNVDDLNPTPESSEELRQTLRMRFRGCNLGPRSIDHFLMDFG